jgi:hypothetical protein
MRTERAAGSKRKDKNKFHCRVPEIHGEKRKERGKAEDRPGAHGVLWTGGVGSFFVGRVSLEQRSEKKKLKLPK